MCHSSFSISHCNFYMIACYAFYASRKWIYGELIKRKNDEIAELLAGVVFFSFFLFYHYNSFTIYNSSRYEFTKSVIFCSSDLIRLEKPCTFSGVRHFIFVHLIMWSRYSLVSAIFVFTET